MPYIEKLTSALPLGAHQLALTFADGFAASLDLEPALEGPLFAPLLDPAAFHAVTIEDGVPVWPGGVDIDSATLRIWAESGRVLSVEETNTVSRAEHRMLTQI
jgi:hypothetical protein